MRESRLPRVRASELVGRGWLNTGGRDVTLADLRGKIVILDFWTFCCINCLHVLDELRELEEQHRDVLVIVGVHSPKFVHEADPVALAAAVERYEVHHPVLDDPELVTWSAYTARAWPTLVVIDPEGYVVAQMAGEGHQRNVEILVGELVAEHEAKGTLHRGDGPYVPPAPAAGTLRFPAKAIALPGRAPARRGRRAPQPGRARGRTARRWSGASAPASAGSSTAVPTRRGSASRTACAWCPTSCGAGSATTCSSPTRSTTRCAGVRLADGHGHDGRRAPASSTWSARRTTCWRRTRTSPTRSRRPCRSSATRATLARVRLHAGAGAAHVRPGPRRQKLSSPWDVAWSSRSARSSSRWPATTRCGRSTTSRARSSTLGGTMNEGLLDGPLHEAWFAQPSGLAVGAGRAALARRLRDVGAALGRTRLERHRAHGRRRGAVRLRPPRRRRRRGAAAAPARRRGRCPTARSSSPTPTTARSAASTRPDGDRGEHARDRPRRAERDRRAARTAASDRCSSSSPPRTGSRGSRCPRRSSARSSTPARTARSGP